MHWRIGCNGGTGSATDADVDAALALVMASKQWNDNSYLTAAKSLIDWMAQNDISGSSVKPGSNWNDAFNPSYGSLANFELFSKVSGGTWSSVVNTAGNDLLKCQNSKSGLVPDWCSWNSYQPTKTNASVAQNEDPGFYDDAARTPWRTAWSFYWYGNATAKKFNQNIINWLYDATHTASGINSGYHMDGTPELSTTRNFVSSTFSGGLGLASSSFPDDPTSVAYMETVYNALKSMTSCEQAEGCGKGSVAGEKYYPATLNILYLLLMTGNMPNFYDMTGFVKFTPDQSLASSVATSTIPGTQQAVKDSSVGLSGFWNWGAYHDKYNVTANDGKVYGDKSTVMAPDSGTSPLFLNNGVITAEAVMEIGAEPEWTKDAADNKLLRYPSAGIAMSFLADDKKGVNLKALGAQYLKIEVKAEGPIRMGILSEKTAEDGGEAGIFLPTSSDYKTLTFDLTPLEYGFVGLSNEGGDALEILSWVDRNSAPEGNEIITAVKGLKFELKDAKGGFGKISIKSVEFLDASKKPIDPALITGMSVPETPSSPLSIVRANATIAAQLSVAGKNVSISAQPGTPFAVFSMQGSVVASGKVSFGNATITVSSNGTYLVRIGSKVSKVTVK